MIDLAKLLADKIWAALIWFLRRPRIKRWRFRAMGLDRGIDSRRVQRNIRLERWSRRHGRSLIKWALWLLMMSVLITLVYRVVLYWLASGLLDQPVIAE